MLANARTAARICIEVFRVVNGMLCTFMRILSPLHDAAGGCAMYSSLLSMEVLVSLYDLCGLKSWRMLMHHTHGFTAAFGICGRAIVNCEGVVTAVESNVVTSESESDP